MCDFYGTVVPSCKFPGCTRPKFKEPDTGREHDFCGRTHYLQYMRQQEQGRRHCLHSFALILYHCILSPLVIVAQERQCKTPGCYRQQRIQDDGEGYYDYCSLTCRDKGQMQMSGVLTCCQCLISTYVAMVMDSTARVQYV